MTLRKRKKKRKDRDHPLNNPKQENMKNYQKNREQCLQIASSLTKCSSFTRKWLIFQLKL